MKPAPVSYRRAESVGHAVELLEEYGDEAKLIAGGQSLLPLMSLRFARPGLLVDIADLRQLTYVESDGATIEAGALTTHAALERLSFPRTDARSVFPETAKWIGHAPIRTRGTIGGSLAHADPTAEWCALAVALDAEVVIASRDGSRTERAEDFVQGPFWTTLGADELITSVRVPTMPDAAAFEEYARRHGDFGIVLAATSFSLDGDRIRAPRVVLGGVAGTPVRVSTVESLLEGRTLTEDLLSESAIATSDVVDPPTDGRASAGYRRRLAGALVRRALRRAHDRLSTIDEGAAGV